MAAVLRTWADPQSPTCLVDLAAQADSAGPLEFARYGRHCSPVWWADVRSPMEKRCR